MDISNSTSMTLRLEEYLTIGMAALLNILILTFMRLGQAGDIFVLNVLIIAAILAVNRVQKRFSHEWLRFFSDWYVPVFLLVIYLENSRLIPLLNPNDMDKVLISLDRIFFLGNHPTILLEKITIPMLSETLQLTYASFYFLPFTLCLLLYLKRSFALFHVGASTILMGFYLSYLGYYITPAIGPRFTLDPLQSFPLTGLFLFDLIRELLAGVEGMMRDCCPSGHATVSLLTVMLARRYARGFFPIACIWAFFITVSTVYLRYHYVTDIIVGLALGYAIYRWGLMRIEAIVQKGTDTWYPVEIVP